MVQRRHSPFAHPGTGPPLSGFAIRQPPSAFLNHPTNNRHTPTAKGTNQKRYRAETKSPPPLHYTTLHYTTQYFTTLHSLSTTALLWMCSKYLGALDYLSDCRPRSVPLFSSISTPPSSWLPTHIHIVFSPSI
jgi:hypothetical protein